MSEPGTGGHAGDEPIDDHADAATPAGTPGESAPGEAASASGPNPPPDAGDAGGVPEAGGVAESSPGGTAAEAEPGEAVAVAGPAEDRPGGLRGRVVSLRFRLPQTRRGIFALLLVAGAFAFAGLWTSVTLVNWTETADFCGRCHQMDPELKGYELGAHSDVTCGECHVEPGVTGWVKAKLNGTRQLIQVLTNTYPKPIPPPDHDELPSVQDTCLKCHALDRLATSTVYTRQSFAQDEPNTPSTIGLMIRPNGGNPYDVNRSVHWHVIQDVQFRSSDEQTAKIDYVEVIRDDGTTAEFIAQDRIKVGEDVQPEIDQIKATEKDRRMDCLQCHNRVGHPLANPRTGMDRDLAADAISPTLPYVKREGVRILSAAYPDFATADAEAEKLSGFYSLDYPAVASNQAAEIAQAITQIKLLYRLTAVPDMKVTYTSYPTFLGHQDFPGCFRCHDGGHFEVVNGAVTTTVIPFTCNTCHTWPQLGSQVATLPLGEPPKTHADSLWVFNHKNVATSANPGGQSCGECHAKDYCDNCHKTGAIYINHDQMSTNHAEVIRTNGNASCAYCHQTVFCARCHGDEQVMPPTSPWVAGGPSPTGATGNPAAAPTGIRWPLVARGPSVAGRASP